MRSVCAQVDCKEDATHLVVETHGLAMLFRSGAGLVCDRHAQELDRLGGLDLGRIQDVVIAVERDDPKRPAARPLGSIPHAGGPPLAHGVVPLSGGKPPIGGEEGGE